MAFHIKYRHSFNGHAHEMNFYPSDEINCSTSLDGEMSNVQGYLHSRSIGK